MNAATRGNLDFYESFAPLYPAVYGLFDTGEMVMQWLRILEDEGFVASKAKRNEQSPHLLDAACGPGNFLAAWAEAGFDVTGVDFSSTMLRLAADEWKRVRPNQPSRLFQANLCEPDSIAEWRGSFDFVVSHSHLPNLIHPEDLPALFQSVSNCLRIGGSWVVDHSRIVATLPVGQEQHSVSSTIKLLRISDFDEVQRRCIQSWAGPDFRGREVYWFPELTDLDTIALQHQLKLRRRVEWLPNRQAEPFREVQASTERLLSIYGKV
jgi:SAM-dependent methyltransferase